MRASLFVLLAGLAIASAAEAQTPDTTIRLQLKGHLFTPDDVKAPAGQRFRLEVVNADPTADEFESSALKLERDIGPHGKLIFQLGPLQPGDYPFVGDLHSDTAKGVLHVVAK